MPDIKDLNCGYEQLTYYRCVVLPDVVEEKTSGGLYKPIQTVDKEKMRTAKCTFIMCSEKAFRDWGGYRPEPGDRVMVAIYSGQLFDGPDGREYRLTNDQDILGKIVE